MAAKQASGIGKVALVLGLVSMFALMLTFAVAAYIGRHFPALVNQQSPAMLMLGLAVLLLVALALLSAILAVVALTQPDRRKGAALGGLLLAAISLSATAFMVIVGLGAL